MSFLGPKIWNKFSSEIKTAASAASFTYPLKKEILGKLHEQENFFDFFFFNFLEFMHSFILTVDWFFTEFPCIHIARGTLIEITIWIFFRSSLPSSI